jgi:hypothetical protein
MYDIDSLKIIILTIRQIDRKKIIISLDATLNWKKFVIIRKINARYAILKRSGQLK